MEQLTCTSELYTSSMICKKSNLLTIHILNSKLMFLYQFLATSRLLVIEDVFAHKSYQIRLKMEPFICIKSLICRPYLFPFFCFFEVIWWFVGWHLAFDFQNDNDFSFLILLVLDFLLFCWNLGLWSEQHSVECTCTYTSSSVMEFR